MEWIKSFERSWNVKPPSVEAEIEAGVYLVVEPRILLYKSLGPKVSAAAGLKVEAEAGAGSEIGGAGFDLYAEARAGLYFDLEVKGGIYSIDLGDPLTRKLGKIFKKAEIVIVEQKFPIHEWKWRASTRKSLLAVKELSFEEAVAFSKKGSLPARRKTFTIQNLGDETLNWSASVKEGEDLIGLSPLSGTLAPKAEAAVRLSLDDPSGLETGRSRAEFVFANRDRSANQVERKYAVNVVPDDLPAPKLRIAEATADHVDFSWDAVSGAAFYKLYETVEGDGYSRSLIAGNLKGASHRHDLQARGVKKYFLLACKEAIVCSRPSNVVQTSVNPISAGMVLIPAGEFTMGSNDGGSDERPVHQVELDAFFIDQYEVTVERYAKCVSAGKCDTPTTGGQYNWGKSDRQNHPVNGVDWDDAKNFCSYENKRLPTEAEWERAATWKDGTKYKYPSGKDSVSCTDAVMREGGYGCGKDRTWPVGSKPKEINGTYDMAGNILEWVHDRYGDYPSSKQTNPKGPSSGSSRVDRGGGWRSYASSLRGADRSGIESALRFDFLGFRCAVSQ